MRQSFRKKIMLLIIVLIVPTLANSQTSVGYDDPSDFSSLLEYRLPDWSYRVWDARFSLDGGGRDYRWDGMVEYTNNTSLLLGSDFRQARESERHQYVFQVATLGKYLREHHSGAQFEDQNHDLSSSFSFQGDSNHFLAGGPFSVRWGGALRHEYREQVGSMRSLDNWSDRGFYARRISYTALAGLGWGRVRSIEPVLRAQRLSERLVALGREPLTDDQRQKVAAVWAQKSDYEQIYDRHERYFWDDVLTPILALSTPLTAYEILYLMDVFKEDLTGRYEGAEVALGYRHQWSDTYYGGIDNIARWHQPNISVRIARNLSLAHQLLMIGEYGYVWSRSSASEHTAADYRFALSHLWQWSDRYRLDTELAYTGGLDIEGENIHQRGGLQSVLNIYLENQLTLQFDAKVSFSWHEKQDWERQDWSWSYGVGLVYHLDRVIF